MPSHLLADNAVNPVCGDHQITRMGLSIIAVDYNSLFGMIDFRNPVVSEQSRLLL
jgi:hypothetical protein